eukprot:SAG11_NODE_864_length_6839_cov_4.807567_5_plen_214_part_00
MAHKDKVDTSISEISQLSTLGLDVTDPQQLKEDIGSMILEMQKLRNENAELQKEQKRARAVEKELRGEISWLQRDKEAFQNKTRSVESELQKENAALSMRVMGLENHTKKNLRYINARLDQCEADSFAQVVERRQTQELQTPACGREAVDSMLAVCCAAPVGNGHRLQESVGCDSLPPTCSIQCSYQFISIFDSCHDDALMRALSAEQLAAAG